MVMDISSIVMTVLSGMLVKSFAARTALQVSVVVTTAGFVGSVEGGPAHGQLVPVVSLAPAHPGLGVPSVELGHCLLEKLRLAVKL